MRAANIFEAIAPKPWTILGLKLRPFSLGHLVLLHRVESAFVTGEAITYDDLAVSVFICSRSYEDALAAFSDPSLPKAMRRWALKVHGATWFRKGKAIDFGAKCLMFSEYLKEGDWEPTYQVDGERTRTVNLPFVQSVRVKLQSTFRLSDSEIFNRGWALCKVDYFTLCDQAGLIRIYDADALDSLKQTRELAAQVENRLRDNKIQVRWQ